MPSAALAQIKFSTSLGTVITIIIDLSQAAGWRKAENLVWLSGKKH